MYVEVVANYKCVLIEVCYVLSLMRVECPVLIKCIVKRQNIHKTYKCSLCCFHVLKIKTNFIASVFLYSYTVEKTKHRKTIYS